LPGVGVGEATAIDLKMSAPTSSRRAAGVSFRRSPRQRQKRLSGQCGSGNNGLYRPRRRQCQSAFDEALHVQREDRGVAEISTHVAKPYTEMSLRRAVAKCRQHQRCCGRHAAACAAAPSVGMLCIHRLRSGEFTHVVPVSNESQRRSSAACYGAANCLYAQSGRSFIGRGDDGFMARGAASAAAARYRR